MRPGAWLRQSAAKFAQLIPSVEVSIGKDSNATIGRIPLATESALEAPRIVGPRLTPMP